MMLPIKPRWSNAPGTGRGVLIRYQGDRNARIVVDAKSEIKAALDKTTLE
jgi:hypothetical protein